MLSLIKVSTLALGLAVSLFVRMDTSTSKPLIYCAIISTAKMSFYCNEVTVIPTLHALYLVLFNPILKGEDGAVYRWDGSFKNYEFTGTVRRLTLT